MTAQELVAAVRARGASLALAPDGALALLRKSRVPERLREAVRAQKPEILEVLRVELADRAADIARRARLLRDCRWEPCSLEECAFHIGRASEPCWRCGASVPEHYGLAAPAEAAQWKR